MSARSEIADAVLLCKCICANAPESVVVMLSSSVVTLSSPVVTLSSPVVAVAGGVLEMGCPTVPVEPVDDTVTSLEEVDSPV